MVRRLPPAGLVGPVLDERVSLMSDNKTYSSFAEFYPFYLQEHSNLTCRVLHYIGSLLVLATLAYCLINQQYVWILVCPLIGYGFAWVGHFFFEHNKPATFKYPVWSFMGDWVMLFQFLTGTLPKQHFRETH